jgi:hypothetical protein
MSPATVGGRQLRWPRRRAPPRASEGRTGQAPPQPATGSSAGHRGRDGRSAGHAAACGKELRRPRGISAASSGELVRTEEPRR